MLVFSPVPITAAAFSIDGGSPVLLTQANACTFQETKREGERPWPGPSLTAPEQRGALAARPLFTAPWVPSTYASGLHTIVVTASNGVNSSSVTFQVRARPSTAL